MTHMALLKVIQSHKYSYHSQYISHALVWIPAGTTLARLCVTIVWLMQKVSFYWVSRGRAFLWTVPLQHVYFLNLFSYAIVNMIHKASLALPLHASSQGFSFPHPPTPTPPPLICTQTQPGRGGLVEGGSSALSIGLRPVEQSTSSHLLPRPL